MDFWDRSCWKAHPAWLSTVTAPELDKVLIDQAFHSCSQAHSRFGPAAELRFSLCGFLTSHFICPTSLALAVHFSIFKALAKQVFGFKGTVKGVDCALQLCSPGCCSLPCAATRATRQRSEIRYQ